MKKSAILIRGYHYKEDLKTLSSYYNRNGKYTLDYRRYFLQNIKENFNMDEYDIFIVSYRSKITDEMIRDLNPVNHLLLDENETNTISNNQVTNFMKGLKMIKDYTDEKNIVYKHIYVTRFDMMITKKTLLLMLNACDNSVTVFIDINNKNNIHYDFIMMIDFNILYDYLEYMKKEYLSRTINLPQNSKITEKTTNDIKAIHNFTNYTKYNYIKKHHEEISELMKIDREHDQHLSYEAKNKNLYKK
jgi:hypothetical protein